MSITPIVPNSIGSIVGNGTSLSNVKSTDTNFSELLNNAINSLDNAQKVSQNDDIMLATGQSDDLPKVMIDAEKADISLQMALSVRDKVLNAYEEVMRMQL